MAVVPSVNQKIQLEETQYLDSQGKLLENLGQAINFLIDQAQSTLLGRIQISVFDEEAFQSRRGDVWVLMQGQDITGSDLEVLTGITTLPDMRSRFLRTIDESAGVDPDSPRTSLSEQEDNNANHNHILGETSSQQGNLDLGNNRRYANEAFFAGLPYQLLRSNGNEVNVLGITRATGTNFYPINYSVNHFIRINL